MEYLSRFTPKQLKEINKGWGKVVSTSGKPTKEVEKKWSQLAPRERQKKHAERLKWFINLKK